MAYAWRRLTGQFGRDKRTLLKTVKTAEQPVSLEEIKLALYENKFPIKPNSPTLTGYLQCILNELFDEGKIDKEREYKLSETLFRYYVRKR